MLPDSTVCHPLHSSPWCSRQRTAPLAGCRAPFRSASRKRRRQAMQTRTLSSPRFDERPASFPRLIRQKADCFLSNERLCGQSVTGSGMMLARIASPIVWLVCACQGCPQRGSALPNGFLFAAPPLTVLTEPGTWRLGIRAGICRQFVDALVGPSARMFQPMPVVSSCGMRFVV